MNFQPLHSFTYWVSALRGSQSNPADIAYTAGIGKVAVPNAGTNFLGFHATSCAGVLFRDGAASN